MRRRSLPHALRIALLLWPAPLRPAQTEAALLGALLVAALAGAPGVGARGEDELSVR